MFDFPDDFDASGYSRSTGGVRVGSTMRAVWLVVALLGCSPEPEMVTICESRGSDPTGPVFCARCYCGEFNEPNGSHVCNEAGCNCAEFAPPAPVLAYRETSCDQCGRVCVEPEIPCGAGCTAPDVACPDRPSPYACRMREVPVE